MHLVSKDATQQNLKQGIPSIFFCAQLQHPAGQVLQAVTVLVLSLVRVGSQDPLVTCSWAGKRGSATNAEMHEVTLVPGLFWGI